MCSGGHFPAGADVRYPKSCVYPGVLAFYKGLDMAFVDRIWVRLASSSTDQAWNLYWFCMFVNCLNHWTTHRIAQPKGSQLSENIPSFAIAEACCWKLYHSALCTILCHLSSLISSIKNVHAGFIILQSLARQILLPAGWLLFLSILQKGTASAFLLSPAGVGHKIVYSRYVYTWWNDSMQQSPRYSHQMITSLSTPQTRFNRWQALQCL